MLQIGPCDTVHCSNAPTISLDIVLKAIWQNIDRGQNNSSNGKKAEMHVFLGFEIFRGSILSLLKSYDEIQERIFMQNFKISPKYRVFFSHWYPPKKLKYGKPRLGESTLT